MNEEDYREHPILYWLFFIPIALLVVVCWLVTKLQLRRLSRIVLMAFVGSLIIGVPMLVPVFFIFMSHGLKMLGAVIAMWFILLFGPLFLYLCFTEKEKTSMCIAIKLRKPP